MSLAAEISPSHLEIVALKPNSVRDRRPLMAMILIGVSLLATPFWLVAMFLAAKAMLG
jgi:hypothetical protein